MQKPYSDALLGGTWTWDDADDDLARELVEDVEILADELAGDFGEA